MNKKYNTICFYCSIGIAVLKLKERNFCSGECFQNYRRTIPIPDAMDKWLASVDRTPGQGPNGDCWVWTGLVSTWGYGRFVFPKGISTGAHIASYMLHTGDLETKGFHICHSCDNKICVNPAHLFKGTQQDNIADMVSKQRHIFGEGHPNAVLSEQQVVNLRSRAGAGESVSSLAEECGITLSSAYRIIKGARYSNIPLGPPLKLTHMTDTEALDLRAKKKAGVPNKDLALEFGITERSVRRIVQGARFKHLPL